MFMQKVVFEWISPDHKLKKTEKCYKLATPSGECIYKYPKETGLPPKSIENNQGTEFKNISDSSKPKVQKDKIQTSAVDFNDMHDFSYKLARRSGECIYKYPKEPGLLPKYVDHNRGTEVNIISDSSRPKAQKDNMQTNGIDSKEKQSVCYNLVGPSGECIYKYPKEDALSPKSIENSKGAEFHYFPDSSTTKDQKNKMQTNVMDCKDKSDVCYKIVGSSGENIYKYPKEPGLLPKSIENNQETDSKFFSDSSKPKDQKDKIQTNVIDCKDNNDGCYKLVGSNGECIYKYPIEPELSLKSNGNDPCSEVNISSDSSKTKAQKDEIQTNVLKSKDKHDICNKILSPSGECIYKYPIKPKLYPKIVENDPFTEVNIISDSSRAITHEHKAEANVIESKEKQNVSFNLVGSMGECSYKYPNEPELSPTYIENDKKTEVTIVSDSSEPINDKKENTITNVFDHNDKQIVCHESIGPSGDYVYNVLSQTVEPPRSKCINTVLTKRSDQRNIFTQTEYNNDQIKGILKPYVAATSLPRSEDINTCSRDISAKRNIFTQTENKTNQRKVIAKPSDIRKSSSASSIDQLNTISHYKDNLHLKSRKYGSTIVSKNHYEVSEPNASKVIVKTTHFSSSLVSPQTKTIPSKSPNLEKKSLKNSVDKLQRVPSKNIAQESMAQSHTATLLRDIIKNYDYKEFDSNVYGELLVLGCDDNTSCGSNRFVLRKPQKATGVKEVTSATYIQPTPIRKQKVSFQVSSSRSVVVEYIRDTTTDMFQIGRHEHLPIDIHLTNINTGRKGISRFACRLIIQRNSKPLQARIYAAAFDGSGNIFLGEEAIVNVGPGGPMDGFTTNGVHILQPGGEWREVSVRGKLYPVRVLGETSSSRRALQEEENLLVDGTLIDLCGITLLWRTREGLLNTPSRYSLNKMECLLKELAPEYPRKKGPLTGEVYWDNTKRALAFLSCGHVVTMTLRLKDSMDGWSCPECRCIGPVASLKVGKERGFYADKDLLSYAFRPCGHVATLRTVMFWSSVTIPPQRNTHEKGVCPFCATKLHPVIKYVRLIYQDQ